jgi:hypothetical protein
LAKIQKPSIPVPCHELWEMMDVVEKGRHCQKCDKTILDFTNTSDHDLSQVLAQTTGSICGRFKRGQLVQTVEPSQMQLLRRFCVAAIIVFGTSLFTMSSAVANKIQEHLTPVFNEAITVVDGFVVIKGTITDHQTGDPIPFAAITVTNPDGSMVMGTTTDVDGQYSFKIDLNQFSKKDLQLSISVLGYEPVKFMLNETSLHADRITIQNFELHQDIFSVGIVITVESMEEKSGHNGRINITEFDDDDQ